jgi:hypothetical protein
MDLTEIIRNITGLATPTPAPVAPPPAPPPAPAGGVRTPEPMGGGTATMAPPPPAAAPAGPAPGTAGSPPDMTQLYQKLLDQQRSDKYIDKGAALIAAGFAQPQNRAAILNSVGNGGGGGDTSPGSALQTILSLQKDQQAKATRLQQQARLPAIARRYGLDMDTVNYLFETGKLDETINSLAQPDMVIETRADGSKYLMNKKNGQKGRELEGPNPERNLTSDLKELDRVNAERAAKGQEAIPAETWLTESAKNKANKTEVNLGAKLDLKAGENRLSQLNDAGKAVESGLATIDKVHSALDTLDKGIISGNVLAPAATEARKLVGSVFGFTDETANNTDAFTSQMKEVVLPRVKALGTGNSISNADREFVEKAVGGSNVLDATTIREILRILEKGERNALAKYNKSVDDFAGIDEDTKKASRFVQRYKAPTVRAKPESMERLRTEYAKGGDAAKNVIKQFNDYFGAGAAESVLEQQ